VNDDRNVPPNHLGGADVPVLVENLFRHAHGRLISRLTRHMGPAHFDRAEDAVQHAMIQALRTWPFRGIPTTPEAWLYTTARNRILDTLRRDSRLERERGDVIEPALPKTPYFPCEIDDDVLRMIFVCCHPSLPLASRLSLTLKTLCGLGTQEIAHAFLVPDATIAQRIVRAKKHLQAPEIRFEIPDPDQLPDRLESVTRVLYLLFNEGHSASGDDELVRADLAKEAIRLIELVLGNPRVATPNIHALAALMYFQASRFPARVSDDGLMTVLGEQNRDLWDKTLIAKGLAHLNAASGPGALSRYHCEAGIAAAHAQANAMEDTDWGYIVEMYEVLERIEPSPVISLNRAVAVARRDGPVAGLKIAKSLARDPALRAYRLLPAILGALSLEAGGFDEAQGYLETALKHPFSQPERRLLETRLRCARDRIT
jgi:RNA polymerase sigma-70 factor, ECF subfamily